MAKTDTFELKAQHVGMSVPNLEASIKWYQDMLGFTVAKRAEIPPLKAKIAFMKRGDFYIELFEVEGAAPLPDDRRYPNKDLLTHGTKHISFAVNDVRKVMEILKKRGVDVAMENVMEGKPMAFIRDNSGNLVEISEVGSL